MKYVRNSQAVATSILETLESRGPLPVGYLARLFDRHASEIRQYLDELARIDLVEVFTEGKEQMVMVTHGKGGTSRQKPAPACKVH